MARPRWYAPLAAAGITLLLGGACTEGEVEPLPAPPSVPATTTTVAVDFSGIALKSVPGRTTTTVALQPGQSTISGTVVGPNGPVPQAIVRAERIVGDASASVDMVAGADGSFAFAGILGGRYRVRAWKPAPDSLALTEPEVFFLASRESKVLALTVRPFQGVSVSTDIAPNPPLVDELANLVVQVVDQQVDAQGIVRAVPVVGARVELFGAGDWRLRSPAAQLTDAGGRANFALECQRTGAQPLSAVVGDNLTFPLELPPCDAPAAPEQPPPVATTRPPSTTTQAPATSTSTR